MFRKITRATIVFIMLLSINISSTIVVQANDTINMELCIGDDTLYINGNVSKLDAAPLLRNGRTMVPIRPIAEALGAEVEWTTYMLEDAVFIDPSQGAYSYYIIIGKKEVVVWTNPFDENFDPNLKINTTLDSAAFIENNRTYLPLRFVAESLGATVSWDNDTQTITIVK